MHYSKHPKPGRREAEHSFISFRHRWFEGKPRSVLRCGKSRRWQCQPRCFLFLPPLLCSRCETQISDWGRSSWEKKAETGRLVESWDEVTESARWLKEWTVYNFLVHALARPLLCVRVQESLCMCVCVLEGWQALSKQGGENEQRDRERGAPCMVILTRCPVDQIQMRTWWPHNSSLGDLPMRPSVISVFESAAWTRLAAPRVCPVNIFTLFCATQTQLCSAGVPAA